MVPESGFGAYTHIMWDDASDTGWDQTQGLEPEEFGLIYGDESS